MWRIIIAALALICLGLLGYYAATKRAVQISANLAVSANTAVRAKVAGVKVVVDQRDARLVGSVSSDALKADAERAVASLSGIKSVKNELVVELPAPAPHEEPKGPDAPPQVDPVPTAPPTKPTEAQAADVAEPAAATPLLHVTWDGTTLVAKGALPEALKKEVGLAFVSDFPDATIKDETTVTTAAATPEVARAMRAAVKVVGLLVSADVRVDEADFELSGVAKDAGTEAQVKAVVADEVKGHASTVTLTLAAAAADVDAVAPAEDTAAPAAPVPGDGPLTPAQCQSAIDALLEGKERITFKGPTGRLDEAGEAKVGAVWQILSRCPEAKGQIVGYHDHLGEPDKVKQLTSIRAYNVLKKLVELGMDKERFKSTGAGQRDFEYPNTGETRVWNQRVEFRIEVQ